MRRDNPAVFECKKSNNTLHFWKLNKHGNAICKNCQIVLNVVDTAEVFEGYYEERKELE